MAKQRRTKATADEVEKAGGFHLDTLKKYASAGAAATLAKLREEVEIIERTFPELSTGQGRQAIAVAVGKRASRMTAAGRASVSKRMKKYWAERRKAAAKTSSAKE